MVSKTGKTQVANNIIPIGIYGNMNKYTDKIPSLVYKACRTILLSVETVVG